MKLILLCISLLLAGISAKTPRTGIEKYINQVLYALHLKNVLFLCFQQNRAQQLASG